MRPLIPILLILSPLTGVCQKKKGRTPDIHSVRADLVRQAEVASTVGDLDSAEVLLAEASGMGYDPMVMALRADIRLLQGDTVAYCRMVPTQRPEDAGRKAIFGRLCTRTDSMPFADTGLAPTDFPGINKVRRIWSRAEDRVVHRLYDEHDSLRAAFHLADGDTIFHHCEQIAAFPGGETEMFKFLGGHIRYPQLAVDAGIMGTIHTTFVVGRDGTLTRIGLRRGVHPSVDEESLRVVGRMPRWVPASHHGRPVPFQFNLPVRFVLR